jgi:N-acetylglucosamine kinase-like BadF-type ATPase
MTRGDGTYLLGVDGGNTKTIALVADADGSIVGAARGGCGDIYASFSNLTPAVALSEALATIEATVQSALHMAGLAPSSLFAGGFSLAGADWPEDIALLRAAMRERGFGRQIDVVNDAMGALRAGSPDGSGVSVVCGTGGAIGACSPEGRQWHGSNWLESFGAELLAHDMLRAVYRAELDLDPPTTLTRRALRICNVDTVEDILHQVTAHGSTARPDRRRLVQALLEEAHEGDIAARQVVDSHAARIAEYALVAARQVGLQGRPFKLVLAGGVLQHASPLLGEAIAARVRAVESQVEAVWAVAPPVVGALLLAFDRAKVAVNAAVNARLTATLPSPSLFATGAEE